jgi:nucleotide-binding universal stress UspA family protein
MENITRRLSMEIMNNEPKFLILLADDGSEHAQAAVTMLADMKLPRTSHIHVLGVITPVQAAEHVKFDSVLERTTNSLISRSLDADGELLLGYPAEKVIEYADVHKPDLIVLGAKGLRSTLGILLGGVAQQVVEYACCPVLIVRAPFNGLNRILVASDGSKSSMSALKFISAFPILGDVQMDVIHVLPPPPLMMPVVEPMFMDLTTSEPWEITEEEAARRKNEEDEGEILLETCCEQLMRNGIKANGVLKRGDAATEIIEYVKHEKIDLIVTGSRGLSQLRSWLMGSVSRKLVHYSGCSILVVRGMDK